MLKRTRALTVALVWICLCVVATGPSVARAEPAWDGLDRLAEIAAEIGVPLIARDVVSLSTLSRSDALLLIGPRNQLPVAEIAAFLRDGGRVALLDDVGAAPRLLATYQVQRVKPPPNTPSLRGNPDLLVAYPATEHPLTEGVPLLLTNRAMALAHPDLKPVFTFGQSALALVLSGAVGPGRLIVAGDGSVLINQLIALPSHRRFAQNLLRYLARPDGQVVLVGPDTVIRGRYGAGEDSARDSWNSVLRRISRPNLTPQMVAFSSVVMAGLAALAAFVLVPRKSPYARPLASADTGGDGQRADGTRWRRRADYAWQALALKHELDAELRLRLDLQGHESGPALLARATQAGLTVGDARALASLLHELRRVADAMDAPLRRRLGGSELLNMIRLAETLLAKIGSDGR